MHEEDPGKSRHGGLIVWVLLVPVLYALSTGPAVMWEKRYHRGGYNSRALELIYGPIIFLVEAHTPVSKPLKEYWSFWRRL